MSRIRSIKPEFFKSLSAQKVSMPARILMASLFTQADDDGRLEDAPRCIGGLAFPYDTDVTDADVVRMLDELESKDRMIERYTVGGRGYIRIPNFRKHQRISHPTPSRLPEPSPEVLPKSSGDDSGKSPEPLRKDLGTGNREQGVGAGSGNAAPAAPPAPAHPKPRSPKLMGRGVQGLEEAKWKPKTPEALLERHRAAFDARPAYDGRNGRLSPLEKTASLFGAYSDAYDAKGPQIADAKFVSWIADDYGKHRLAWERDGYGGASEPPKRPPPTSDEPPYDPLWDGPRDPGGRR